MGESVLKIVEKYIKLYEQTNRSLLPAIASGPRDLREWQGLTKLWYTLFALNEIGQLKK